MKNRNGFVSNSSSSSFIVISPENKNYNLELSDDGIFHGGLLGNTEFGWENIRYSSIYDKINFAYIQTNYGDDDAKLYMLETVLKENINGLKNIVWHISENYNATSGQVWGYIDHQSSYSEGVNLEMFNSTDELRDFIFGKNSYIQGGNDNE